MHAAIPDLVRGYERDLLRYCEVPAERYGDALQVLRDEEERSRIEPDDCTATEGILDADSWWYTHRWLLAASPGWAEAWAYARSSGKESIGLDEAVITDGDILAAVQTLIDNGTVP